MSELLIGKSTWNNKEDEIYPHYLFLSWRCGSPRFLYNLSTKNPLIYQKITKQYESLFCGKKQVSKVISKKKTKREEFNKKMSIYSPGSSMEGESKQE